MDLIFFDSNPVTDLYLANPNTKYSDVFYEPGMPRPDYDRLSDVKVHS